MYYVSKRFDDPSQSHIDDVIGKLVKDSFREKQPHKKQQYKLLGNHEDLDAIFEIYCQVEKHYRRNNDISVTWTTYGTSHYPPGYLFVEAKEKGDWWTKLGSIPLKDIIGEDNKIDLSKAVRFSCSGCGASDALVNNKCTYCGSVFTERRPNV